MVLGGSLSVRQENRKWIREERRTAYLEFLIAARRWGHICRTRITEGVRKWRRGSHDGSCEQREYDELYNELLRKYDYVRLLAEDSVQSLSTKVFSAARSMAVTINRASEQARTQTFERDTKLAISERDWTEIVNHYYDAVDQFVSAAHKSITSTGT